MKVWELIHELQKLGIEHQNDEVTVIHMDFPHSVRSVEVEPNAAVYENHYHIDYYPEARDAEDGPLVSVVVIR